MATDLYCNAKIERFQIESGHFLKWLLMPFFLILLQLILFSTQVHAGENHRIVASHTLPLSIKAPVYKDIGYSTKVMTWKSPDKTRATIICLHALGLSSHAFSDFGQALSQKGFDVYATDARGFGCNRNVDGLDKLDLSRTVNDIKQLIDIVHKEDPDQKIFLVGESMGGAIVLKAASQYPDLIDGVIVSAPAYKLYKLKRLTFKGLGDLLFPGLGPAAKSVMFQATSSQKLRDHWREDNDNHKLELSFGEALSYYRFVRNTPKYSSKIKTTPVCIMHGLQDNLARPEGSAQLFNSITSNKKLLVIDCKAEHLLLEEKQLTNRILALSVNWLNQQLALTQKNKLQHLLILKDNVLNSEDQEMLQKIRHESGVQQLKANTGSML